MQLSFFPNHRYRWFAIKLYTESLINAGMRMKIYRSNHLPPKSFNTFNAAVERV